MASEIGHIDKSPTRQDTIDDSFIDDLDAAITVADQEIAIGGDIVRGGHAVIKRGQQNRARGFAIAEQALIQAVKNGRPPRILLQRWGDIVTRISYPLEERPDTEEILRRFELLRPGTPVIDVPTRSTKSNHMAGIVAGEPGVGFTSVGTAQGELPPVVRIDVPLRTHVQPDAEPRKENVRLYIEQLLAITIGREAIDDLERKFSGVSRHSDILEQLDVLRKLEALEQNA